MEEGGQNIQTFIIRQISTRNVMYNMTILKVAVLVYLKVKSIVPRDSHHKE